MALIPLHKAITREVLKEAGFSDRAVDRSAIANAKVDDKQGNDAVEANLHAMIGYVTDAAGNLPKGRRLQKESEAKQRVEALLTEATVGTTLAVLQSDFLQALDLLGAALHTVQDRAFHSFEPSRMPALPKGSKTIRTICSRTACAIWVESAAWTSRRVTVALTSPPSGPFN